MTNGNDIWKDSTAYSRDAKVKRQTAWTLELPSYSITITRGHIYYPNEFVMHCHAVGIDAKPLGLDGSKIDEAKEKAVQFVRSRLNNYLVQLNSIEQLSKTESK